MWKAKDILTKLYVYKKKNTRKQQSKIKKKINIKYKTNTVQNKNNGTFIYYYN